MKRIVSILMIVAMIASVAAVNVSAAGQIYMQDNFDEHDFNRWCADVSKFYVEDGWLVGDHTAVVHQTMYGVEPGDDSGRVNMTWTECYVSVDIRLDDYSSDQEDFGAGLWWKDYQLAPGEEWYEGFEYSKGGIYSLTLHTETNRVALWGNYEELEPETEEYTGTDTTAAVEEEEEVPLMEAVFPAGTFKVDFTDPVIVNLGMEVTSTGISAFLNGKYLFTWNSPTALGQNQPSPILLLNDDLLVGFDNFMVTSLDWDGIPEKTQPIVTTPVGGGEQGGQQGGQQGGNVAPKPVETQKVIETEKVIVTDTDAEGNIVTREEIVTKEVIVTVPSADTNTNGTAGGTSTSTGDMAVIVIAVMIVSLGAAIVVKKVNIK